MNLITNNAIHETSMPTPHETILSTLPGSCDNQRVLLVLCRCSDGESRVELRQQSWGEGLGWFTQNSVRLEPEQVADLRTALGNRTAQQRNRPTTSTGQEARFRIVRSESA